MALSGRGRLLTNTLPQRLGWSAVHVDTAVHKRRTEPEARPQEETSEARARWQTLGRLRSWQ